MSALAEALVAAQAELPCAISRDADGQIGQRSYRYLTLDKLIAETRPISAKARACANAVPDDGTPRRRDVCTRSDDDASPR